MSSRLGDVPISVNCDASLSFPSLGGVCVAAATAKSAYGAVRLPPVSKTVPALVVSVDASTPHCFAAAAISIARAAAPAPRITRYMSAMLVLPPVVMSLNTGSAYWSCAGAICTRTRSNGTSSSSATSMGSPVYTPWPISLLLMSTATVPSVRTCTHAFGANVTLGSGDGL